MRLCFEAGQPLPRQNTSRRRRCRGRQAAFFLLSIPAAPDARLMLATMLPDSITHAIERVKGRLVHIASTGAFANAIVQPKRAAATSRSSSPNE
jgi:hypothetical protein